MSSIKIQPMNRSRIEGSCNATDLDCRGLPLVLPALTGGEWPDGPNKKWFENLQRPDNHLAPSQRPQVAVLLRHRRHEAGDNASRMDRT
jgi:hypothetical protein